MTRIAPPDERPAHTETIMWLRQFANMLEALNRHEADGGVLFFLISEWRAECRDELLNCGGPSLLVNRSLNKFQTAHQALVDFVNAVCLDIEAFYGWPPPAEVHIEETRIAQLRSYASELGQCRERVERKD